MITTQFARSKVSTLYVSSLLAVLLFFVGAFYSFPGDANFTFGPWGLKFPFWLVLVLGVLLSGFYPFFLQNYFLGNLKLFKPHMYFPLVGILLLGYAMAVGNGILGIIILYLVTMFYYGIVVQDLNTSPVYRQLNIALLIGVLIHLDVYLSLLILVQVVSLFIFGRISTRTLFTVLLGVLFLSYFSLGIAFLFDYHQDYIHWLVGLPGIFSVSQFNIVKEDFIFVGYILFWVLISIKDYLAVISRAKVNKRQVFAFLLFSSLILFGPSVLWKNYSIWIAMSFPVAIMLTNAIQYQKRRWLADTWFLVSFFWMGYLLIVYK